MRAAVLMVMIAACGSSGGSDPFGEITTQDDASDEALETFIDVFLQGNADTDARASSWVAPAAGTSLSRATPPTFEWTPDPDLARHGRKTGRFVWLQLKGQGDPLNVASIESAAFTPSASEWALVSTGTTLTATLVTAELVEGLVEMGPWIPDEPTRTFTLGP